MVQFNDEMQRDLPKKWEKHGDMIILPHNCFTLPQWRLLGELLGSGQDRLLCDKIWNDNARLWIERHESYAAKTYWKCGITLVTVCMFCFVRE